MESLKGLRKSRGFTQEQMASLVGISRRTYQRYEEDESSVDIEKLRKTICKILNLLFIDKTHGILSLNEIGQKVRLVCEKYPDVECVYL